MSTWCCPRCLLQWEAEKSEKCSGCGFEVDPVIKGTPIGEKHVQLTKKMRRQYLVANDHCPMCDGNKIFSELPVFETGKMTRERYCFTCESEWTEHFQLIDITMEEPCNQPPKEPGVPSTTSR